MYKNIFIILLITIIFTGCSNKPKIIAPTLSAVELRTIQSTELSNVDTSKVNKVIFQLLQDDNFEIKNVNSELGFFNASKILDGGKEKYQFAWYDIYYPIAIYKLTTLGRYTNEINSTISVREFQNKVLIRSSFTSEIKDEDGNLVSKSTIEDKKFYQEFYSKLSKALFLDNNKL